MSKDIKDINDLFPKDFDIEKIVKVATKKYLTGKTLKESFVAQPKSQPQVTEFITQKTKDAHTKLYEEHAATFTRVSSTLDSVDRSVSNSNNSTFRSLKIDETRNLNSTWLHELYFANCFDPNSNVYMNSISFLKLQAGWGKFDDWQHDFISCAMSCGQGWAITGYHLFLRQYVNTFITEDSQDAMVGIIPVIVLDMHEHARRDYLNDKKSYIIAMMREMNWSILDERFERTEAIARIVR